MKHILLICIFLLNAIAWSLQASVDIQSKSFIVKDGLGNNLVHQIIQDNKGFLWMSTLDGLTRYDGYSFITIRSDKAQTISLSGNHVLDVSEDANGFLWAKTSQEFYSCYDPKQECFVDFTGVGAYKEKYTQRLETSCGDSWLWHEHPAGCRKISYKNNCFSSMVYTMENGTLPSDNILWIKEGEQGKVWVVTTGGITSITDNHSEIIPTQLNIKTVIEQNNAAYFLTAEGDIYQKVKNELKHILKLNKKDSSFILTDNFLFQGMWVILTKQESYLFNPSNHQLTHDKRIEVPNGQAIHDDKGNLWIYDGREKIRYINSEKEIVKDLPINIKNMSSNNYHILEDSRGLIWIATCGDGLYIYNPTADETTHYTYQIGGLNHINSSSLIYIMEDSSGNIWTSSDNAGISCLSVINGGASYIYPETNVQDNKSNAIRLLTFLKNGELWIGNQGGSIYQYDEKLKKQTGKKEYPTSITKVKETGDGKIWMGSRGNGLFVDNCWYTYEPHDKNSLSHTRVSDIYSDYKERIWIGTFGGGINLAIAEKDRYKFQQYLSGDLPMQEIRMIVEDKNHWLWAGTDYGLFVFHPDSIIKFPTHYYNYNYENNSLLSNEVKYIYCDNKGQMWLGTLGGGISLCTLDEEYDKLKFTHFTTTEGLVNNVVQSIIEDRSGKLWIATEYGISRFNTENKTFENYFFSSNTFENIYTEASVIMLPDGRLLFGSAHGVTVIDPEKIDSNGHTLNVEFTDLKINGITAHVGDKDSPLTSTLSYVNNIELMHYQNSFVIEFSAFDCSVTDKCKYTYKLDNFDKEWSIPSTLNFAAYKNITPGTYRLRVKSCNTTGIWSDRETILNITITPPYWKTTWAYIIYLLIVSAIFYMTFRLIQKFNTLSYRIQVEKQLTEYKLMFFTNISHEFRTPLTMIQGALEKIERIEKIPKEMNHPIQLMSKNTQRMMRLINQLLEFRKMQNNKLALMLEETDIMVFLYEISQDFKEIATDKNIDFHFITSVSSYPMFIDKGKLDKIVYNLLSNAFKYTPHNGKITFSITIDEEKEQLILCVSDTGVGIPKEKQKELFSRFMQSSFSHDSVGIGLHLTHELVNIHKGHISYSEKPETGSVFTVTLPTNKNIYPAEDFLIPNELSEPQSEYSLSNIVLKVEKTADAQVPLNKKNLLIIEDNSDVRHFLEEELRVYFNVTSEPDGLAGLEHAQSQDLDLIICDVLMPGMNGFDVTRKLKSNFDTSHIPIILLTAMSTPENQLEGVESGADAYITKPFSPKLLLARIFQLIEQREKLRNKFSNDPNVLNSTLCSTELDKKFAERLQIIMEKQIVNPDFTIEDFATILNMGRTIFFRKVKGITGYTPNEYMRIIRMKKAIELLQEGCYNISEIAYMVGMKDPLYFSKCFKSQFGVPPSSYLRNKNIENKT